MKKMCMSSADRVVLSVLCRTGTALFPVGGEEQSGCPKEYVSAAAGRKYYLVGR